MRGQFSPSRRFTIYQDDPYPLIRQMAVVEKDDIEQEAALLELMGKVPNRRIIRARLSGQQRSYLMSTLPEEAVPLSYLNPTPLPSDETIELLVDWALDQIAPIQEQFFRFLESPEDHLDETLRVLGQHQEIFIAARPKRVPIASILVTALPATKEQLYDLARGLIQTERPEATVRQWLRRGLRNGDLEIDPSTGRISSPHASNDATDS